MDELFNKKTLSMKVTLPSRGQLYGGLLPSGEVEVSAMTTMEEKILAGSGGTASSKLDTILSRCTKLPEGIKADDLLISDRFYLLLIVRSLSYGSKYGYQVRCPDCSTRSDKEIDLLTDLDVKLYPEGSPVAEPFHIKLPHSGDDLGFRLLRGSDEKAITKFSESKFAKVDDVGDPAYIHRMARQIKNINGKDVNVLEAQAYVEKMYSPDSLALRDAIEEADCGTDMEVKEECRNCGSHYETTLPFTVEFFRPRRKKVRTNS